MFPFCRPPPAISHELSRLQSSCPPPPPSSLRPAVGASWFVWRDHVREGRLFRDLLPSRIGLQSPLPLLLVGPTRDSPPQAPFPPQFCPVNATRRVSCPLPSPFPLTVPLSFCQYARSPSQRRYSRSEAFHGSPDHEPTRVYQLTHVLPFPNNP